MVGSGERELLRIKKYPNRRFYDVSRSRHVTLKDICALVLEGHDVSVTDSRSGEDITNVVLLQVLLEHDQPKLDLFPTTILHLILRSNRQALRAFVNQFFGPFLGLFAKSQRQFDHFLREAMRGRLATPMDWANLMMGAFAPSSGVEGNGAEPLDIPEPDFEPGSREEDTVDELRGQLAQLKEQIDALANKKKDEE